MRARSTLAVAAVVVTVWVVAGPVGAIHRPAPRVACERCGWLPPVTNTIVTVGSVDELTDAVRKAQPSTTILVKDGHYDLPYSLDFRQPDVVLRGRSGNPSKVVIAGAGMNERRVGVALSITAPRVTIADLTVGHVGYHGVQVRGETGASNVVLHNIQVADTGQQLVKVSISSTRAAADDGLLACSTLGYSDHAPSAYTNGIDALGSKGWVVRDNRFYRIRGPQDQHFGAGPAVLFWANSIDTIVERNVVIDSFRGIALGLQSHVDSSPRPGDKRFDHTGGVIRNNVVCNLNAWADEGIEANGARDVQIDHNTVLVEGSLPWSISIRFPSTTGWARNNLTNRRILFRNGGDALLKGNVSDARPDWFVSAGSCDLRLTDRAGAAIHAGVPLAAVTDDFDRRPRGDAAPDAGAFIHVGKP